MSQPRRKLSAFCLLHVLIIASLISCRSAPITSRKQLLLLPEDYEVQLGIDSYHKTLADELPSTNEQYIDLVKRVGHRIAQVANRPDYQWEFRVIASPEQNAFALPGGKVAVYEGILPVCATESGLAVVMSHEIAHALARHGGERMSQGMMVNAAGNVLKYITQTQQEFDQELLLEAYGAASKYGVVLPFSRKQESEADKMGLMLMARAGYDPSVAPLFWERFASSKAGDVLPEFLSTHPSDARRALELRQSLPDAVALYQQAQSKFGDGEDIMYAQAPTGVGQSR